MKNKIIIILSCLLFLSVSYNVWWVGFESTANKKTIQELNRGAEIDYNYVNSMAELVTDEYNLWHNCNTMFSEDLKGTVSDQELSNWLPVYTEQINALVEKNKNIQKIKDDRSKEFATFEYVTVYKPE